MERLLTNTIYRFLFENSFDAIMLTHPNGHVYRANPAACEMFQRTEEEICQLGRPCVVDIINPRLEPALEERLKQGKVRTELNFKRKTALFSLRSVHPPSLKTSKERSGRSSSCEICH